MAALVITLLPLGVLGAPKTARAAAMNTGNPYTNGHLSRCSNSPNEPGYNIWALNVGMNVTGVTRIGSASPPGYPFPSFLTSIDPHISGWGVSDFSYQLLSVNNPSQINYGALPPTTHCCMHDLETSTPDKVRYVQFFLVSMQEDAGLYTGTFLFFIAGLDGDQASAGTSYMTITWQNTGKLRITKASANAGVSQDNACYSLDGAAYGVYTSAASADAGTGAVTTVNLSGAGASSTGVSVDLPVGAYYVRERVAPPGYLTDATVYPVAVTAGQTTALNVKDQPGAGSARVIVLKTDAETGKQTPQGAASLAGARFSVCYYDGFYTQASLPALPTRSWVFQTDEQGRVVFDKGASFVAGDALYLDAGATVMPQGTYTCREAQASPGYLLPDQPTIFLTRVVPDASSVEGVTCEGDLFPGASAESASSARQPEQVIRGDVEIAKIRDADNGTDVQTGLAGIDFTLTSITTAQVYTITTNDRGFATTKALLPAGSALAGGLPYDTYVVHEAEQTVPKGLNLVKDFTAQIAGDGQCLQYVLNDSTITAAVRLLKKDAQTGKVIGGAPAVFEVLDADKQVLSFTVHSPKEQTVTQFHTDEDGQVTLPARLSWGTYFIHEVGAPAGYLPGADVIFSVTKDQGFDDPLVVAVMNEPQLAQVELTKLDQESSEQLDGALYGVYAATDIVTADDTLRVRQGELVDIISTEASDAALSVALFCGPYELRELVAPAGYLVDTACYPVDLACDSEVATVTAALTVKDRFTRLTVSKLDLVTGEELPGAELALSGPDGSIVATWTTNGAPHRIDQLSPGDYLLSETCVPEGYLISQNVSFTVKATGEIQRVVMQDAPRPVAALDGARSSLPQAGDWLRNFWPLVLGTLLLLAVCGAGIALQSRRTRQEEEQRTRKRIR